MPRHCIVLPNGNRVLVGTYVAAWRTLKTMDPQQLIAGFSWFPTPAGEVLTEMRRGLADRINRRDPAHGRGRKWDPDWQTETWRASRALNTPRLVIHWLPPWLKARYAHRLFDPSDY